MKRLLCTASAALLLTGCAAAAPETDALTPVQIVPGAATALSEADGFVYPEDAAAYTLNCRMLMPKAVGWYQTADGVMRFCDPSGSNLITMEYRSGDDFARCYASYLHEIGTELPENRICTYDLQTVGVGAYTAYRIDARETEENQPERLMTYWFIDKPRASENRRSGCYIVTFDTTAENLELMTGCIRSFSTLADFDPDRSFTEGGAAK